MYVRLCSSVSLCCRKPRDSLAPGGAIAHCIIEKRDTGFGFAEPYYIHRTLKDLVLHYSETSLFEHNDELDTMLKYPVHRPAGYVTLSRRQTQQVHDSSIVINCKPLA